MEQKQNTSSRKKFVLWGLGIISSVTALKLVFQGKKKKTAVKMLTEDGKLVEVDPDLIKKNGKKISNKEILTWIKNKPTL